MASTQTKPVEITNMQRLELYKAFQGYRAESGADMRGHALVFKEFALDDVEAAILVMGRQPTTEAEVAAYNAAFELRFPLTGAPPSELQVSEAGAAVLRGYFDNLAKFFPAGRDGAGNAIPAGLPAGAVRRLTPVLAAIDEAWPAAGKA